MEKKNSICVCVSRDCRCILPFVLFCLVLNHRCRYATYSKSETKAEKAKPEIINKLNSIFVMLPAFELRRVRNSRCDAILSFIAFVKNSFSVRHLMQKTLKRGKRVEKRIFITKEKSFSCFTNLSPLKIRSLMKSYCYSIFHLISLL